jgi:AcrR family transcriptional regulator
VDALTARQSELADAALRILGRDGIAAVSFRAVATESGWSLGAVQKAFASKADLDAAVLQRLRESSVTMPPGEPGRPTLRGWLVELALAVLPLDAARREATLRGAAFAERAAFDEAIGRTIAGGDAGIRGLVARLVSRARAEGEVPAELDPDRVAWAFLALITGAATQLLYDPVPEDDVRTLVDDAVRGLLSR